MLINWRSFTFLVMILAMLLSAISTYAQQSTSSAATVIDLASETSTDRYYATLIDSADDLTIDQLISPTSKHQWQVRHKDVSRGVVATPIWMRFAITNSSNKINDFLFEHTDPGPLSITLYIITVDNLVESTLNYHREAPYRLRPYPNPSPVFPVKLNQGETRIVYAKIKTTFGGLFSQFAIWQPDEFIIHETQETALYGGVYTTFLIFSFVSLLMFFAVKDRAFLSYSGLTLISCITLMNLDAHWAALIQTDGAPAKNATIVAGIYFFIAITFIRDYLKLDLILPWASKAYRLVTPISPIIIILGLLNYVEIAGIFMMLILPIILTIPFLSLYLAVFKQQKVKLFTLAWLIYGSAILIQFALRQVGIVPHQPLTIYTGAIGAMFEMCLLATSMGLRLRELVKDHNKIQKAYVDHLELFSEKLQQQVTVKTHELEQAKKHAELEARTDTLTQLFNRRAFNEMAPKMVKIAARNKKVLTTIIIDIDYFKLINDNYGHDCGDEVLSVIANTLKTTLRENDLLARMGGEEFAIMTISENDNNAIDFCQRIRQSIEQQEINVADKIITITVSLGVFCTEGEHNIDTLLHYADKALYLSKANGRNKVTLWQNDDSYE
ncbi:MAG: sensor domain-containing diguanylate cyclase [Thalassotalea sp.]